MGWVWIDESIVHAVHDEQVAEHGGRSGLRDAGLLDSALARPRNLAAYGDDPGLADLAAANGYGLAQNHPFIDGNKRTAFVVVELFLDLNGWELTAEDDPCVQVMLGVADGSASEPELAEWLRRNMKARS